MKKILTIKNLNKKYSNFSLQDINIDIPYGAIVGFIGENGAGKTTTIKAILNLIKADSGSITIFDEDYQKESLKEDVGVILDNSFMPEGYTLIDINKVMKLMYKNWTEELFFNYAGKFSLPKNQYIREFSSGMLMKLKIITALSHNPKLLILDEPTSGLDPVARSEILDIFSDFIDDTNHAIFVSSHITSDLEHIADYIYFINKGKIILNSNKDELLKKYYIVKCSEKDYSKIDYNDIIKFKKDKENYKLLINNYSNFKKKYKIKDINNASLDDIMLLYIKGE